MTDDEIEALRVRLEAALRDAERYRWLRAARHWPACFDSIHAPEPLSGEDLDATIDAGMKYRRA
jgi:hypothetical protein